jgi:DNA-binding transcriptional regulator/RsmH inhibitor MraZ
MGISRISGIGRSFGDNRFRPMLGLHLCKVDEKGRIVLPKAFRNWIGEEKHLFIVAKKNREGGFDIFPPAVFESRRKKLKEKERERFCQCSFSLEIDDRHRITIPQKLWELLGSGKKREVRIGGAGDHLVLYLGEEWKKVFGIK